jgi:hydroxymethylbilane synthase
MSAPERIIIGTRGSALARWQADHITAELRRLYPDLIVEQQIVVTEGDRKQTGTVIDLGGKGVWVKEIEEKLLAGDIDLAVHSLKDVPAHLPDGLALVAIPPRADPRDALVSRSGATLAELPPGSRIGTSSLRRVCQLRAARPDLEVGMLRGNVDTRLRKLDEGHYDAIVLAHAGLRRLGLADRPLWPIPPEVSLPAVGQGALALECRADDAETLATLRALEDDTTRICVEAERAFLAALDGDCKTPMAAHATLDGERLQLRGLLADADGSRPRRGQRDGAATDGPALGRALAESLR